MMKYSPMQLFLKARKNTLPENIWVCIAAALIPTFYFYEYQYESFAPIRAPLLLCMTAVIFVIWIICSLFSGRDGRFGFAVFTFLYWGLPFVYTLYYAGRDNLRHYNKWLALINKVCTAILCNPFSEASAKINFTPQAMAAALVFVSLVVYIAGFFLKHSYDAKLADNTGKNYDGEYISDEPADDEAPADMPQRNSDEDDGPLTFGGENDVPDLKSALGITDEDTGADE